MIRAIIYKDFRQQWPWLVGVSLLVITYGVIIFIRWPATINWWSTLLPFFHGRQDGINPTPPLVRLRGIYVLASVYGVVLGLMQGMSDTRGASDFFLHRPCSRTRLAVAKLLGGSLLYWVPGIVVVALLTLWAGFGRFASPFRVWMILVPLLSWWIGYGFYLAAVNVAWRRGRWFGPRLLPAVPAILLAADTLEQPSLTLVLLFLLLFTITYWLIDLHALVGSEDRAVTWNRGWDSAARVLTGLTFLVGLIAVIGFVCALVVNLFPRDLDYTAVVFTKNGEPRIQKYEYDDTGMQVYEWLDLSGRSVGRYRDHRDIPSLRMADSMRAFAIEHWQQQYVTPLRRYGGDSRRPQVFWYLMANDGVVEGYAHPTGTYLGSFGPQGKLEPGSSVRFAAPHQPWATRWRAGTSIGFPFDHLIADGDALYMFDLNPPQMSELWQSDRGHVSRVGLVHDWWNRDEPNQIMVEAGGRLHVLGADATEVGAVDLPATLRDRHKFLSVGWTGERIVASQWRTPGRSVAFAFRPTGEILQRWDIKLHEPEPFVWWKSAVQLPLNLCAAPWIGVVTLIVDDEGQYGESGLTAASYWPLLLMSIVITFVSVMLTRRHLVHRRPRANVIWWAVVVVLLSWPGYLLCRITTRLTKLVGCPACGGRRPPETATCPQCGVDWPLPKRTGFEILLPAHP